MLSIIPNFLNPFFPDLFHLILWPLAGSVVILVLPARQVRLGGLWISLITFVKSLSFWIYFDYSTAQFQFVQTIQWLPSSNVNCYIGIDGISLFF